MDYAKGRWTNIINIMVFFFQCIRNKKCILGGRGNQNVNKHGKVFVYLIWNTKFNIALTLVQAAPPPLGGKPKH